MTPASGEAVERGVLRVVGIDPLAQFVVEGKLAGQDPVCIVVIEPCH